MSDNGPWVWTDCKRCGCQVSARSLKALAEAAAEHDRYEAHLHRPDRVGDTERTDMR